MVSTTVSARPAHQAHPPRPWAPAGDTAAEPGRWRIVAMVAALGEYVRGRAATVRSAPLGPATDLQPDRDALDHIAAGSAVPSVWPRRADKPTTVAHYQAMADQVAEERRLADLDVRLAGHEPHAGVPRELWLTPRTPFDLGVRHDG